MIEEEYAKAGSPVEEWLEQQSDNHSDANAKKTHAHEFERKSMDHAEDDWERLEGEVEDSQNESTPGTES